MSAKQKKDARAVWKAMHDESALDELEEIERMSDAELDAMIESQGGDPRAIRQGGAAFVRGLVERRRALGWQRTMEAKLADVRDNTREKPPLSRDQLFASIDRMRARFPRGVTTHFHKKTLDACTDEELAALFEELELLAKVSGERDDE